MGAAELGAIEESDSEEQNSLLEDSGKSDSNNSQNDEADMQPSVLKISKVIAADDQILNIQVLKSYFAKLSLSK